MQIKIADIVNQHGSRFSHRNQDVSKGVLRASRWLELHSPITTSDPHTVVMHQVAKTVFEKS